MPACSNCGNTEMHAWRVAYPQGERKESCDKCSDGFSGLADIYFKGEYVDEHLASDEFPEPKVIRSRADKKFWLEKCRLREAGDRVHGATSFDPISHRYAMESLRRR